MEQVAVVIPGAVASYSAKSALFSTTVADRGTLFDCTGSFTVTIGTTSLTAGWSCWFRNISGTQTLDPAGAVTINGAANYALSNAGDDVLVMFDGTNFIVSHHQRPSTVAITGGTIEGTPIGGVTAAAGAFTTGSFTGAVSLTTASSGLTISKTTGTTLVVSSTAEATSSTTGSATFAGGIGVVGDSVFGDRVGLGSLSSGAMFNISSNTLSAATERAFVMAFTGTSAATTSIRGLQVSLTGASATTHTTVIGYQMATPTPGGSGGAFTSLYGFSCTDAVAGTATNVAGFFYGDSAPTAGNWAFYNSTTKASFLGGALTVNTGALTVAATTGTTLVVSSTDASNAVSLAGGVTIASGKNLRMGTANVAVTGTTGFVYIPVCTGTPTGTPTALSGTAPLVVDTTNNKLYFYSAGAWRDAGP
jgi:hypothetical protein